MTPLSPHFTLEELCASDTARRLGIANVAPLAAIVSLRTLCVQVLEPVRAHFGRPVHVNSGFRALALNRAIGSSDTSQHRLGEAADIEVPGVSNLEVARWIRDALAFDQLILEAHRAGDPSSGWVHVSYRAGRLRRSVLTMTLGSHGAVYSAGLIA